MNHREFVMAMGEDYQAELVRKCRAYADLMAETIEDMADAVTDEDMADPDAPARFEARANQGFAESATPSLCCLAAGP